MPTPLELLARTPYVRLTTFRRNGAAVPTPVWAVQIGEELCIWTNPEAGKVKRVRRDAHVEIGPCTRTGTPLGVAIPGRARILAPDELARVLPALIDKYGLIARLTTLPNRVNALLGRQPMPIGGLAVTLDR